MVGPVCHLALSGVDLQFLISEVIKDFTDFTARIFVGITQYRFRL